MSKNGHLCKYDNINKWYDPFVRSRVALRSPALVRTRMFVKPVGYVLLHRLGP